MCKALQLAPRGAEKASARLAVVVQVVALRAAAAMAVAAAVEVGKVVAVQVSEEMVAVTTAAVEKEGLAEAVVGLVECQQVQREEIVAGAGMVRVVMATGSLAVAVHVTVRRAAVAMVAAGREEEATVEGGVAATVWAAVMVVKAAVPGCPQVGVVARSDVGSTEEAE